MGLQELINKYGNRPKMDNWMKLKEADDKEFMELSLRISPELREYLDINENGNLEIIKEVPEELQFLVSCVMENFSKAKSRTDLTEY